MKNKLLISFTGRQRKKILSEMLEAGRDMALYDDLYKSFRKIRHDFANYIQNSGFETEDEIFILRVRVLKKDTLVLVNSLLDRLHNLDINLQDPDPVSIYPYLAACSAEDSMKASGCRTLQLLWDEMKGYFVLQQKQLSTVEKVLLNLQDRLERSLPPDEEESRIHLAECDSISCHMTADDPLTAAYLFVFRNACLENGADFRFRIRIPKTFEGKTAELYHIFALAYENAKAFTKSCPESLVRILLAEGMGLWHFMLELKPSKASEEKDIPAEKASGGNEEGLAAGVNMTETVFEETISSDRTLKKILRKMDASMKVKREDGGVCIDIVG